jgi:hypothetical protein
MERRALSSTMRAMVVAGLLLGGAAAPLARPELAADVSAKVEKNVDFARFKTYSWTPSQPAPVKATDDRIVAAVDRELQSLGLTKTDNGTGDVLVTYSALRGNGNAVDGLVVGMLDPGTRRRLLQLRADTPIDSAASVDSVVAELFTQYPTRVSR